MLLTKFSGQNESEANMEQPMTDHSIEAILRDYQTKKTDEVLLIIRQNAKNGISKREIAEKLNSKYTI